MALKEIFVATAGSIPGITKEQQAAYESQVQRFQEYDKAGRYRRARSAAAYAEELLGFTYTLDYARSVKGSNRFADVAAGGTAKAITQIARGPYGRGLEFIATNLSDLRETEAESVPFYLTTAEEMNGIPPHSLAGCFSVFGTTYTTLPEVVVRNIDDRLVDGGVVKMVVSGQKMEPWLNPKNIAFFTSVNAKTVSDFIPHFEALRYQWAVLPWKDRDILLAIKPGGDPAVSPGELLEKDMKQFFASRILKRARTMDTASQLVFQRQMASDPDLQLSNWINEVDDEVSYVRR